MQYLNLRLSAAMWARVLLLWLSLALGAFILGGIAIGMGFFIGNNIRQELVSQQINFPQADALSEQEYAIPGMVENAGKQLETGNQARVWSEYIALHMRESAEEAGFPDASYATLGQPQRELRAQVTAAEKAGDEKALAEAQERLDAVTGLRNTMLTGNNLRANLLSAFGWDNVGIGVIVAGIIMFVMGVIFLLLYLFERRKGHLPAPE